VQRLIKALFTGIALFMGSQAVAQERVVLVELFTSQGCNSCPPADEYAAELAERENVLPLLLHVDYWDYLGWRDPFAQPAFTQRQKDYAYHHGARSVYTPQMIIGGVVSAVGHNRAEVEAAIARQQQVQSAVLIQARIDGNVLNVVLEPQRAGVAGTVHVVRYAPELTTSIARGENSGRTLTYTNVVTQWSTIAMWSGDSAELSMPMMGDAGHGTAVIVQDGAVGPVLAAVALD
jgi:hypothetical protein